MTDSRNLEKSEGDSSSTSPDKPWPIRIDANTGVTDERMALIAKAVQKLLNAQLKEKGRADVCIHIIDDGTVDISI